VGAAIQYGFPIQAVSLYIFVIRVNAAIQAPVPAVIGYFN
jgi:hypothetical protein